MLRVLGDLAATVDLVSKMELREFYEYFLPCLLNVEERENGERGEMAHAWVGKKKTESLGIWGEPKSGGGPGASTQGHVFAKR